MIPLFIVTDFVRVDTPRYSMDVPKGWTVGEETPWGARDILREGDKGKFGAMTAGPTTASWEQLYRTSLGFILREEKGEPTPFRTGKSKKGFETMSFEVKNDKGFASRRYVLLKNKDGRALALSVKIPSLAEEKEYATKFRRMVDSAILK